MICPKCHYEWKIKIRRCKCGCYLDHGENENTWKEPAWTQEHKIFIDSLPYEKQLDWYENSGNKEEQIKHFEKFKRDSELYHSSSKDVSENEYKSFKSNTHLIKRIIIEAVGKNADIFASYGDIKCTDKDESCKSILVINDHKGLGDGKIIEVADNDYKLLLKLIKKLI